MTRVYPNIFWQGQNNVIYGIIKFFNIAAGADDPAGPAHEKSITSEQHGFKLVGNGIVVMPWSMQGCKGEFTQMKCLVVCYGCLLYTSDAADE